MRFALQAQLCRGFGHICLIRIRLSLWTAWNQSHFTSCVVSLRAQSLGPFYLYYTQSHFTTFLTATQYVITHLQVISRCRTLALLTNLIQPFQLSKNVFLTLSPGWLWIGEWWRDRSNTCCVLKETYSSVNEYRRYWHWFFWPCQKSWRDIWQQLIYAPTGDKYLHSSVCRTSVNRFDLSVCNRRCHQKTQLCLCTFQTGLL